MESAGLIPAINSLGYTVQAAAEGVTVPNPVILKGSNWFFGGTINKATGQGHNA